MKVETIFQKELSLIHDKTIKQFVIDCFDKLCPDYFWTCPCSTTGKYHPQVSLGVGGLVRHTKLAVWWGLELAKAMELEKYHDEIVATLLLHDMIKNGKGLNAKGYPLDRGVTGTHGVTLAEKIVELDLVPTISESSVRILAGIALHMGIWTTKRYNTIDVAGLESFIDLIHLADYCASRKVDEIYYKLETEITYDFIKESTITTGKNAEVTKSPPCPGIRETKGPCNTTDY